MPAAPEPPIPVNTFSVSPFIPQLILTAPPTAENAAMPFPAQVLEATSPAERSLPSSESCHRSARQEHSALPGTTWYC